MMVTRAGRGIGRRCDLDVFDPKLDQYVLADGRAVLRRQDYHLRAFRRMRPRRRCGLRQSARAGEQTHDEQGRMAHGMISVADKLASYADRSAYGLCCK